MRYIITVALVIVILISMSLAYVAYNNADTHQVLKSRTTNSNISTQQNKIPANSLSNQHRMEKTITGPIYRDSISSHTNDNSSVIDISIQLIDEYYKSSPPLFGSGYAKSLSNLKFHFESGIPISQTQLSTIQFLARNILKQIENIDPPTSQPDIYSIHIVVGSVYDLLGHVGDSSDALVLTQILESALEDPSQNKKQLLHTQLDILLRTLNKLDKTKTNQILSKILDSTRQYYNGFHKLYYTAVDVSRQNKIQNDHEIIDWMLTNRNQTNTLKAIVITLFHSNDRSMLHSLNSMSTWTEPVKNQIEAHLQTLENTNSTNTK